MTFVIIHTLLKISLYIPAPLIALGVSTWLGATVMKDSNLVLVKTKYGDIPTDFLQFTPPQFPPTWNAAMIGELAFYAMAFAFVCGFESILAARMADRLANNKGTKYNPDKEFWGQGLIQTFVPMLNGMPLSGALARTATSIKLGAVTPLAGIMKCFLKLALAYFLADQLELVPMACIGGILLWVAYNMVKPKEMAELEARKHLPFRFDDLHRRHRHLPGLPSRSPFRDGDFRNHLLLHRPLRRSEGCRRTGPLSHGAMIRFTPLRRIGIFIAGVGTAHAEIRSHVTHCPRRAPFSIHQEEVKPRE